MIRQAKCLLPVYYHHSLAILCKVTDKVFHSSGCGFHLLHALTFTILLESLMLTTCIRGFFLVIKHLSTWRKGLTQFNGKKGDLVGVFWSLHILATHSYLIWGQLAPVLWAEKSPVIHCCHSAAQLCLTLCYPMDCSTPGFPVLHHLLELAQTHIHRVGDAIQPSHPLLPPSPPAFNLSQHQGISQWVSSWHQVAKVLELQL